jgi:hypothetical protein
MKNIDWKQILKNIWYVITHSAIPRIIISIAVLCFAVTIFVCAISPGNQFWNTFLNACGLAYGATVFITLIVLLMSWVFSGE